MQIDLILDPKLPNELKTSFFNLLKSKQTKRIEKIEWKTVATKPGQMGNGAVISAIGTVVENSQTGLVELFKTIQVWIQMHQKEVSLSGSFGETMIIKTNKLSEKGLMELADKFLIDSKLAQQGKLNTDRRVDPKFLNAETKDTKKERVKTAAKQNINKELAPINNALDNTVANKNVVTNKNNQVNKNNSTDKNNPANNVVNDADNKLADKKMATKKGQDKKNQVKEQANVQPVVTTTTDKIEDPKNKKK
jgi:hypothetical protein